MGTTSHENEDTDRKTDEDEEYSSKLVPETPTRNMEELDII